MEKEKDLGELKRISPSPSKDKSFISVRSTRHSAIIISPTKSGEHRSPSPNTKLIRNYFGPNDLKEQFADKHELKMENLQQIKSTIANFIRTVYKKKANVEVLREEINTALPQLEALAQKDIWQEKVEYFTLKDEIRIYLFRTIFQLHYETTEDKKLDKSLRDRMDQLFWIAPQHLEIPTQHAESNDFWTIALTELEQLNKLDTPAEKLNCILNACKVIIHLLQISSSAASADDFLPHLIYVVLKSSISNYHTNIRFISELTGSSEMVGEHYCFFTHLVSAVTFIGMMDASSLKISKEQFARYMGNQSIDRPSFDKALIESSSSSKKALKLLGVKESGNSSLPTSPKSKDSGSSFLSSNSQEKIWDQKTILKHITEEYPYLLFEFEKLNQQQLRDVFFAYKWMSMSLAVQISSQTTMGSEPSALTIGPQYAVFRKMFVIKVKENGDPFYKMLLTEIVSMEKLKNDIGERFGGGHMNPKRVAKLILLPDVILERDEDVKFIQNESQLEVYFQKEKSFVQ